LWLKIIKDYKYMGDIIYKEGTSGYVNDLEFAGLLVNNGYAVPDYKLKFDSN
jgi:hypothetical protein